MEKMSMDEEGIRDLSDTKHEEIIAKIKDWVTGPGLKLLTSLNSKPYNLTEAIEIRKAHERFEFKCLKSIQNFGQLTEFRKNNILNDEMNELDHRVNAYLDKLNKRTLFVVSCFSYFYLIEEIWKLIECVEGELNETGFQDIEPTENVIKQIDSSSTQCYNNIQNLAKELERIKSITVHDDLDYLSHLDNEYRTIERAVYEFEQKCHLLKLRAKKHLKILECESNVNESCGWLDELLENCENIYQSNCVGTNAIENSELLKKLESIENQAVATNDYCTQILQTQEKLQYNNANSSEYGTNNNKRQSRLVRQSRARLERTWPRLRGRLDEFKKRLQAANFVYTNSDLLLDRIREYLLDKSLTPPPIERPNHHIENQDTVFLQLNEAIDQFHELKNAGFKLIYRLPEGLYNHDPMFTDPIIDEIASGIKMRLFSLLVKAREYELTVTGRQTLPNRLDDEDGGHDGYHANNHQMTSAYSLSRGISEPAIGSLLSPCATPPLRARPIRGSSYRSHSYDPLFQPFPSLPNEFASSPRLSTQAGSDYLQLHDSYYQDSKLTSDDSTRQPLENVFRKYNELAIMSSPTNQINEQMTDADFIHTKDQMDEVFANLTYVIRQNGDLQYRASIKATRDKIYLTWLKQWLNVRGESFDSIDSMMTRLNELREDVEACSARLHSLVETACVNSDLVKDEMAANEARLTNSPTSGACIPDRALDQLRGISEEMGEVHNTIPAQESFITALFSEADKLVNPVIREAVNDINQFWSNYKVAHVVAGQFISLLFAAYTLLNELNESHSIVTSTEYVRNSPMMGTHRKLQDKAGELIQPDQLPHCPTLLTKFGITESSFDWLVDSLKLYLTVSDSNPKPKVSEPRFLTYKDRSSSSRSSRSSTPVVPPRPRSRCSLITTSEKDKLRQSKSSQAGSELVRPVTAINTSSAQLSTPPVLPPRSDRHGSRLSNYSTPTASSSNITSSNTTWRITRPLHDLEVTSGQDVDLVCGFVGPSNLSELATSWYFRPLHSADGRDVVRIGTELTKLSLTRATLMLNRLTLQQSGQYTVKIKQLKSGKAMKSNAMLKVLSKPNNNSTSVQQCHTSSSLASPPRQVIEPLPLVVNRQNGHSPSGQSVTLRCQLPVELTRVQSIEWQRDSTTLFTSSRPDAALKMIPSQVKVGSTVWRASLENGQPVLSTDRVHLEDSGLYACCFTVDGRSYQSKGRFDVANESDQPIYFLHRLNPFMTCWLGTAVKFSCQVSSLDVGDDFPEATWTFNNNSVDSRDDLVSIWQSENGWCHLKIREAQRQHAGRFKCQVRQGSSLVESECQLKVLDHTAPKMVNMSCKSEQDFRMGSSASINAEFSGPPGLLVHLNKDGRPLDIDDAKFEVTQTDDLYTLTINNLKLEDSGNYTVILSNALGQDQGTVRLEVESFNSPAKKDSIPVPDSPTIGHYLPQSVIANLASSSLFLIVPPNYELFKGQPLTLVCRLCPSAGDVTVEWLINAQPIVSDNYRLHQPKLGMFVLEFDHVSRSVNHGLYTAVIKSSNQGRSLILDKETFFVTIKPPSGLDIDSKLLSPRILSPRWPSKMPVQLGDRIELTVDVEADPLPAFHWIKDSSRVYRNADGPISVVRSDRQATLLIKSIEEIHLGQWELLCTNAHGYAMTSCLITWDKSRSCDDSSQYAVTRSTTDSTPVNSSSTTASDSDRHSVPYFTERLADQHCLTGRSASLVCMINGRPVPRVKWTFNGHTVKPDSRLTVSRSSTGKNILTINPIRPTDAGTYTVSAFNRLGSTDCSAFLSVTDASPIIRVGSPPGMTEEASRPVSRSTMHSSKDSGTQTPSIHSPSPSTATTGSEKKSTCQNCQSRRSATITNDSSSDSLFPPNNNSEAKPSVHRMKKRNVRHYRSSHFSSPRLVRGLSDSALPRLCPTCLHNRSCESDYHPLVESHVVEKVKRVYMFPSSSPTSCKSPTKDSSTRSPSTRHQSSGSGQRVTSRVDLRVSPRQAAAFINNNGPLSNDEPVKPSPRSPFTDINISSSLHDHEVEGFSTVESSDNESFAAFTRIHMT